MNDEWGYDPQIQMMRKVFTAMEEVQAELLRAARVDLHEPRLRRARDLARLVFDRAWATHASGAELSPDRQAAELYRECLGYALRKNGIIAPGAAAADDERFDRLIRG